MSKAWRLLPDAVVRSAGLPVERLLALGDPEAAEAVLASPPERRDKMWERWARASADRLIELSEHDVFHRALLWQNPGVLERVCAWFSRHAGDERRNAVWRRNEDLLARYAQRYCARNETIGFFGPAVWALFDDATAHAEIVPGPEIVARREIFFEDWLMDDLGALLAENDLLRRHLPPARPAGLMVSGGFAVRSGAAPRRLAPVEAAVLATADGSRSARTIAADLRWRGVAGVRGESDVLDVLERLREHELIRWRPPVPQNRRPEVALRDRLRALPASQERDEALDILRRFDEARTRIAAADRPEALAHALAGMDLLVEEITGASARHTRDRRPLGRSAVFEECERDVRVVMGRSIVDALLPPVTVVLESAKWLTWRFGQCLEALFADLYDRFAGGAQGVPVPLGPLVAEFLDRRLDPAWFGHVLEEFQDCWAAVLAVEPGVRRLQFGAEDLAERVRAAFPAPPPTWYGAAYHSPDVMLAAADAEAVARGEFELVMGELHLAGLTYDAETFTLFHPEESRLRDAVEDALSTHPRVVPAYPRSPEFTGRDSPNSTLTSGLFWYLTFGSADDSRSVPPGRRLDLVDMIAIRDGDIEIRTAEGLRLGVLDVLGEMAYESVVDLFHPLRPAAHTPRVTVDRLVISRETWRLAADDVPGVAEDGEAAAFVALRRWARDQGLPRFVFWRAASQDKPVYLDFDSPLFVNNFLSAVRRIRRRGGGLIRLTEMLPAPEQAWLPDAEGHAYTSELRLGFVYAGGDTSPDRSAATG
ncbi:lantibiotic dehydratase [Sphaerisporangium viridialbum]|uniref:lantibiotic dehydratase n=1 Tax=Sphaerisporangium viridialbum TaxID=46189 RepID=UPI003C795BC4